MIAYPSWLLSAIHNIVWGGAVCRKCTVYAQADTGVVESFLSGLLAKEEDSRLGVVLESTVENGAIVTTSTQDVKGIMSHDWFAEVDWAGLQRKQVPAPWRPGGGDGDGGMSVQ